MPKDCKCKTCVVIYTIIYRPGDEEAVLECKDCGKLWYRIIFERMNFSGANDTFEEYQIPITSEEYQKIVKTKYEDLRLNFLMGRKARVIHEGGVVEKSSDFALSRCGRN
ncbi:MAG: hypothetical protein ACFFBD_07035 [Candidatus Hodarchaeota archaeon]